MILSRWPKANGFESWVTHSVLAHAESDASTGPYAITGPLWEAPPEAWDAVAHNPSVHCFDGKYYLYYTGTHAPPHGSGWWDYRNRQRIGVAVADHPAGPWRRFGCPVLEAAGGSWDDLACSNPSCTQGPDGRFYLIYKGIGADGPMPRGGSVKLGLAIADHPLGPFVRHPHPVMENPAEKWAFEDPFVWVQNGRFFVIAKDFFGVMTGGQRGLLAVASSDDAIHWSKVGNGVASYLEIPFLDGVRQVHRLERPFLLLENGRPHTFSAACKPDETGDRAFNVQLRVKAMRR